MALNPSISSLSSWSSQLEDELAGADKRLDRMVQQTDEALTTVNGATAISAPPSEIVKSLNEVKQELQNMKSEVNNLVNAQKEAIHSILEDFETSAKALVRLQEQVSVTEAK